MTADFYVAVDGNDAWSGKLPAANADRTDGPFVSLRQARDAVRALEKTRPITVLVRRGTYRLDEAFTLGPQDSGTATAPVTYAAYPGETPVFSGGRAIRGFQQQGNLWVANLAAAGEWQRPFLELFVNGQRRPRARAPNTGFFRMEGPLPPTKGADGKDVPDKTGFRFNPGDIQNWARLGDVNIVLIHSWETSIHPVKAVDLEANVLKFPALLKEWWGVGHWERQGRYFVENALELLDQPGEWYLNRDTNELSYMPMPGETLDTTEVVAPVLTEFVRIQGDAAAGLVVEHVHIKGLTFHHADWILDPAGNSNTQAAVDVPAVVTAGAARNCSIEDCEVGHIGNYGIWFRHGCKDCTVSGNHVFDVGAGGIRIGEARMAKDDAGETSHTVVHGNYIHHYGEIYAGAVGIWVAQSSHNWISHNEIHDGYYTGISTGWNWDKSPCRTLHNTIEFNHVHHVVRGMLSDGAGIYTLGTQTGTVIRNNSFHDIFPYLGDPTMAWGIYFDQGTNGITAENNVVYNTLTGGLMNTGQSDNIVRNNVFAFSGWQAVWRWKRDDTGGPSTVERNIFYLTQGDLFHADGGVSDAETKWDHNLYWRTDGEPLMFYDFTFDEWRAKGMDRAAVVADPRFADPASGDFSLKPDSPALALGITSIDMSAVGLPRDSRWFGKTSPQATTVLPPLPPELQPLALDDGFEDTPLGELPKRAKVHVEGKGDSIAVTEERAVAGKRSLKIVDAPGLEQRWNPHLYYQPRFRRGKALLSFDVWLGAGALVTHEWRDSKNPFGVGPSLTFHPDGRVEANGREVAKVPVGEWVNVGIVCGLGPSAQSAYDLTFRAGDRTLAELKAVPCGTATFRSLDWLGFISFADTNAVFYLDNIRLDLEKN